MAFKFNNRSALFSWRIKLWLTSRVRKVLREKGIVLSSMADNHPPRADDVAQQAHNGFGPLSELRGNIATIASTIVVVFSSAVLLFVVRENEKREGIHFLVFKTALLTLSVVLGEIVRRLCLVFEEITHKDARYRGNWKAVLKTTFTFDNFGGILVVAIASALTLCFGLYEQYEVFSSPGFSILFFLNCLVVPQLSFLVGLRQLSPVETSDLNEKENKNVADGLAWSYYFGYLKLVLPKLEQRISESDTFRHKIIDKKLFILLPKTCLIYDDIEEADSRVKWVGNLPESKINRGAIKERSYKHAVYEIVMPDGTNEKYHFIVEYATPLMTLSDMSKFQDAQLTAPERDHQVVLFYRKLKEILDKSKECRGRYELVPFSGDEEKKKIADILVEMHKAMDEEADEVKIPEQ